MNIIELASKIDKSESNENEIDFTSLIEEFNLDTYGGWSEQTRLKSYWLQKHLSTDRWIGKLFYFLDDEFVGYSNKPYRKSSTCYYWLNKGTYNETKDYIAFLFDASDGIDFIDETQDISDGYSLQYVDQLLPCHYNNAYWNGEKVQILEAETTKFLNEKVKINVIERNTNFWCNIDELEFKYHLAEQ